MAISDFPKLERDPFSVTSPADIGYNCIAWAAGSNELWWWPDSGDSYWPPGVPREETVEAFIQAYATLGYERCADGSLETGFEKIAIYANADGPQHAARNLESGRWTSKLGSDEDIEHRTLEALNCDLYGDVVCYLRRPRKRT